MIIAIYKMPSNPLVSFIFTLSSGLLDGIDGNLARYLQQTSKVGMLFDISIDRFTNLAQMFFLSCIFSKYCTAFLLVGFIELARDLVYWVFAFYSFLLTIFNQLYMDQGKNSSLNRQDIYEYLFLNKKPESNPIIRPYGMITHDVIYPLIWYSSDLFYWIILIVTFHVKKSQNDILIKSQSTSCSSRSSADDSPLLTNHEIEINETYSKLRLIEDDKFENEMSNNNKPIFLSNHYNKNISSNLKYFIGIFEYIGKNLEDYFESNIRFRNIKFQKIFSLVGIYFLIMAILKFLLSSYEFFLLTYHLVIIDIKSFDVSRIVKLDDFLKI
jgi:hypothetical protein